MPILEVHRDLAEAMFFGCGEISVEAGHPNFAHRSTAPRILVSNFTWQKLAVPMPCKDWPRSHTL